MKLGIFLLAEALSNLGLFVFFLLYNLYLLDRGFDESFLGILAGLLTAGSLCGTLPAGWFAARYGIGPALRVTFGGGAAVCALQAWVKPPAILGALAFLGGIVQAFRAVSFAPAVAQLSTEQSRPRAFSLFFSLTIAMGIFGGLLGGKLPDWLRGPAGNLQAAKQITLWVGCGIAAMALWPSLWLKFDRPNPMRRKSVIYPRTLFVLRYLAAAAAWNLFVGAFPPFFNAYFARRHEASTAQIGLAFSGSQLAQVAAILLAPVWFARVGLRRGIPATQVVAAILLGSLAPGWGLVPAAVLYAGYVAVQWMSEPGWHSLLMNGVTKEQQGGAAALNFSVIFAAQAVSAPLFGLAVPHLGYPVVLLSTALVGLFSAWAFQRLVGRSHARSDPASAGDSAPG